MTKQTIASKKITLTLTDEEWAAMDDEAMDAASEAFEDALYDLIDAFRTKVKEDGLPGIVNIEEDW